MHDSDMEDDGTNIECDAYTNMLLGMYARVRRHHAQCIANDVLPEMNIRGILTMSMAVQDDLYSLQKLVGHEVPAHILRMLDETQRRIAHEVDARS